MKTVYRLMKLLLFGGWPVFLQLAVWFWVIFISLLEAFTYSGFILKHTLVDPVYVYVMFAGVSYFLLPQIKEENNVFYERFKTINLMLLVVFIILYALFNFFENITFTNFIYSIFHINIQLLLFPIIITAYTTLVIVGLKYVFLAILLILMGLYLNDSVSTLWAQNGKNIIYLINNPNASYADKMRKDLGKQFFDYTMFIKDNTASDSKILLPPFPGYPWPQTGNIPYMRYFLYPRELYNGGEYSPEHELKSEDFDYVLIDWGETETTTLGYTHGWPKFEVEAKQIICTEDNVNKIEYGGNYTFEIYKDKCRWGLIKITDHD